MRAIAVNETENRNNGSGNKERLADFVFVESVQCAFADVQDFAARRVHMSRRRGDHAENRFIVRKR
jgi:hypothetical protein